MIFHFTLASTLLLQELPQEVDGSMHIYGTYERHQFEIKKFCLEWEKEWTVVEDLLHVWWYTLHKIVWVFDAFLQIWVQFVIMEKTWANIWESCL